MSRFGWCAGPEGAKRECQSCPGQIGSTHGILSCSCECHGGRS